MGSKFPKLGHGTDSATEVAWIGAEDYSILECRVRDERGGRGHENGWDPKMLGRDVVGTFGQLVYLHKVRKHPGQTRF